jgi:hypothetical protein
MDRILRTFKEYDMEVLLAKRELVSTELKNSKELQDKLPSHVFLNRSKIDNIARIVYTYISQNIAKKV